MSANKPTPKITRKIFDVSEILVRVIQTYLLGDQSITSILKQEKVNIQNFYNWITLFKKLVESQEWCIEHSEMTTRRAIKQLNVHIRIKEPKKMTKEQYGDHLRKLKEWQKAMKSEKYEPIDTGANSPSSSSPGTDYHPNQLAQPQTQNTCQDYAMNYQYMHQQDQDRLKIHRMVYAASPAANTQEDDNARQNLVEGDQGRNTTGMNYVGNMLPGTIIWSISSSQCSNVTPMDSRIFMTSSGQQQEDEEEQYYQQSNFESLEV